MVSLAWLLENRRSIPAPQMDDFMDTSTVASRFANHIVISWLSGWGPAIASETLTKNDLKTIWDDRVITHACEVFGGVPGVILEPANKALPEDLKTQLGIMTAYPA
jgi:hypothetical protein